MKKLILASIIIAFLLSLLLGLAAVYLVVNSCSIIEKAIGDSLNTTVKIKDISFNRQNHALRFEGMSVYNPQGFNKSEALAEIPDLTIHYDPRNLFKDKKLRLTKITVYIKTLTVIKRQDGKLNVEALNLSDTDINLLPIWADELSLSLDNVLYKELKKKGSAHIEMFEVKIKDKKYRDLENIDHIATNIVLDAMEKTTIKGTVLYTSATLLGVSTGGAGLLTATILSNDNSSKAEFKDGFDDVYNACRQAISGITSSFEENKKSGVISTKLNDTAVTIKIKQLSPGKTQVRVSASLFIIPKPRTAKAILYAISEKLNK